MKLQQDQYLAYLNCPLHNILLATTSKSTSQLFHTLLPHSCNLDLSRLNVASIMTSTIPMEISPNITLDVNNQLTIS